MTTTTIILIVIAAFVGLWLYFLPWTIASNRHHVNTGTIGFLNFVFGWTLVAWILLMIWAIWGERNRAQADADDLLKGQKTIVVAKQEMPYQSGASSTSDEIQKLNSLLKDGAIESKTITIDKIEVLERLQKLRDAGTISDEQFEKEKNKIFL